MTSVDVARGVIADYRATPATSTRRRCSIAVRLMDIIGEYRDRLINGAELLVDHPVHANEDAMRDYWKDLLSVYREAQTIIDELGYTRNELQIAAACHIFDAQVVGRNDQ